MLIRKEYPCMGCDHRTRACHASCREYKIFCIKNELERRARVRYEIATRFTFLTEAEKKRDEKKFKWKEKVSRKRHQK